MEQSKLIIDTYFIRKKCTILGGKDVKLVEGDKLYVAD